MVKLDDVILALEFVNCGNDDYAYYDEDNNKFIYSTEDVSSERLEECIPLPSKYQIDEYSMMDEFIYEIDNPRIRNRLEYAISGRGAFRRFKDVCFDEGIEKDWYNYRDLKYKELAEEWCDRYKIEYK